MIQITGQPVRGLILLVLKLIFVVTGVCADDGIKTFISEPVFDTKIRIVQAGHDNPLTLILLHGIGPEGAQIWNAFIPELARDYHVVACDLPGFGKSEKPNLLYSPEKYNKFIEWLVKRYSRNGFILAGHSFGASLALHYTATASLKPEKLILIDAAGILHRVTLTKFLLHLKIKDTNFYLPPRSLTWFDRLGGTLLEKLQTVPLDIDLILHNKFLREKFLGADPNKIAGLALIQTDFTPLIEKVETPVFLIWGENDEVAPLRTGQLLAGRLKQAQLDLIPDGGHVPMLRQQNAFRQTFWRGLKTVPMNLPPMAETAKDKTGICQDQKDALFSGYYKSIELDGCNNIKLVDVVTQKLSIIDSDLTITRTRINGGDVGLTSTRSRIKATVLDIEACLPILTDQSSFDFAGATLKSSKGQLVAGKGNPSRLLFSVSRGLVQGKKVQLHGVIPVSAGQAFNIEE